MYQSSTSTQRIHHAFDASDLNQKHSTSITRMALTTENSGVQRMVESAKRLSIDLRKKKKTSLMDIPAEVRGLILNEVFAQATLTAVTRSNNRQRPLRLIYTAANRALLRVCQTLRLEATPILLRSTTFVFDGHMPSPKLDQVVPGDVLAGITRMEDPQKCLLEAPLSDYSSFPRLKEIAVNRIWSLYSIIKSCNLDVRRLRSGNDWRTFGFDSEGIMETAIKDTMERRFRDQHSIPESVAVVGTLIFYTRHPNEEVAWLDLATKQLRKR